MIARSKFAATKISVIISLSPLARARPGDVWLRSGTPQRRLADVRRSPRLAPNRPVAQGPRPILSLDKYLRAARFKCRIARFVFRDQPLLDSPRNPDSRVALLSPGNSVHSAMNAGTDLDQREVAFTACLLPKPIAVQPPNDCKRGRQGPAGSVSRISRADGACVRVHVTRCAVVVALGAVRIGRHVGLDIGPAASRVTR